MQLQTVQRPSEGLAFDSVAPRETSTPHVVAAAFYHCLGEPFILGFTLQKLSDESTGSADYQGSIDHRTGEGIRGNYHQARIRWQN